MKPWVVVVGLLVAALVIAFIEFGLPYLAERAEVAKPVTSAQPAAPDTAQALDRSAVQVADEPPAPELPSLDESDEAVRSSLGAWSAPTNWLDQEQLLRRLASLIDNVARRELPRSQLQFLTPVGRFSAVRTGSELVISDDSFARFDTHLDLLETLPPEQAAAIVHTWLPRLDEALRELGRPDADALEVALRAIDNINEVTPLEGSATLVRPTVAYEFADPTLEALPTLDKQLLRIGPSNLARLQAYLAEVRLALAP